MQLGRRGHYVDKGLRLAEAALLMSAVDSASRPAISSSKQRRHAVWYLEPVSKKVGMHGSKERGVARIDEPSVTNAAAADP